MADAESAQVRTVSDVETLKALADPTRLAILGALMRGRGSPLRVMSAKELAAELDEPQTKLYRHIKNLENAGLIRSVSSRVVSGIVEQRYQACQRDLMLGAGLTASQRASQESEATVAAAFELYRRQFFAAHRAELTSQEDQDSEASTAEREPHRRALLGMSVGTIPKSRAAAIHAELTRLVEEVGQAEPADAHDDYVTVNILAGYFTPDQH